MARQVCSAATAQCSLGTAVATFNATPRSVSSSGRLAANVMDHQPLLNVMPFGMCTSLANPAVAAATAAALGVLTPMPCIPNTPMPWAPGAMGVRVDNALALDDRAALMCTWGGVIRIVDAGQTGHEVP